MVDSTSRPARSRGRRNILRGIGGVALALPFMEIFQPKRASAGGTTTPMRYVYAFGGSSLGIDGINFVAPPTEGALTATRGIQPLFDLGVENEASIVSGLLIPWGSTPPSGGRPNNWHSTSLCPLNSGVRSEAGNESVRGPTSDWVVANHIAADTLHPVLAYRVQAANYRGSNGTGGARGRISARMNGDALEHVDPTISPRVAYESLYTGFVPPDPAAAAEAKFLLDRRKSVIDLVTGDTEKLLPRLGKADKIRLERHFDELRSLEGRLDAIAPPDSPNCEQLPQYPDDPPVGGAVENGDEGGYASNGAYSGEEERAAAMIDLIHMAFVCDLSRVASLMFTYGQCFLNMNPLYGHPSDLHELGHYSMGGGNTGANAVADGVAWHVKHWATLIQKLRDTEDVDGTSVLDSTALVMTFEGGLGYDPEQDKEGSAHSSENMVVLVGGRAGGLNASGGQHIRATDRHPVEVINAAMQAVGVNETLGEVDGILDGLTG